jgi:protein-S-isoprenylcysteine O-methyltransferase Ste14
MGYTIFVITLVAEILSAIAVMVSILFPQRRIWPPSQQHAWAGYVMWGLFIISGVGAVAVGIIHWGTMDLAPWVRWILGAPLWLAGNIFALWAITVLGLAESFGDEGTLVRRGPYRFSRNPQYVGFIAGLIGWALVASSTQALVVSLVGTIPLMLVPFAEEPWLLARYGASYEAYKHSVPRFIWVCFIVCK